MFLQPISRRTSSQTLRNSLSMVTLTRLVDVHEQPSLAASARDDGVELLVSEFRRVVRLFRAFRDASSVRQDFRGVRVSLRMSLPAWMVRRFSAIHAHVSSVDVIVDRPQAGDPPVGELAHKNLPGVVWGAPLLDD